MSAKPKRGLMSPPPRNRIGQRRPSAAFSDMNSARRRRSSDVSLGENERQRSASEDFKTGPLLYSDDASSEEELSASAVSQTPNIKSEKVKQKMGIFIYPLISYN